MRFRLPFRRHVDHSRRKVFVFWAIMVLGIVVVAEIAGAAGLIILHHEVVTPWQLQGWRESILRERETTEKSDGISSKDLEQPMIVVQHPYLGFVFDEGQKPADAIGEYHGFSMSKDGIVQRRSEDKVIVGVFGGSVAWFLTDGPRLQDALERAFEKIPAWKGRRVEVMRLAIGGYKQPQQLQTLSYLLSLGAEFDVIVNLDGFNEINALPGPYENPSIYPFFPYIWTLLADQDDDPSTRLLVGEISYLRRRREAWANLWSVPPLRWSEFAGFVWSAWDRCLSVRIARRQTLYLAAQQQTTKPFVVTGPLKTYEDAKGIYADAAKQWARSSILMNGIAHSIGVPYVHLLQPNQYVDPKPMGQEERAIALSDIVIDSGRITLGYGFLQEEGRHLQEQRVYFRDLTGIFRNTKDSVYEDQCCHLNERGNDILAHSVADAIVDAVRSAR